jgi:4-hydroxyphenylpyruvate dioxygenase-like putative hemolysin
MKQMLNHVDHVVWVCKKENLEDYVEKFAQLFDAKFDGPYERDDWFRVYVSWDAGLEITCPLSDGTRAAQHLREHGESAYSMVFGVPDLAAAKARARDLGYEPSEDIDQTGEEPWTYRMEHIKEAYVGKLLGTMMVFGEVIRKDGVAQSR